MLTPDDVHHGRAPTVLAARRRALKAVRAAHPERIVRGRPKTGPLPEVAWINPPDKPTTGEIAQ